MIRVAPPVGSDVRQPDRLTEPSEFAARRDLREQIARLERELQDTLLAAFPRAGIDVTLPGARAAAAPRLLDLGELETLRDALSARLADARSQLAERVDREEANRALLERMLLEPGKYRFTRIA